MQISDQLLIAIVSVSLIGLLLILFYGFIVLWINREKADFRVKRDGIESNKNANRHFRFLWKDVKTISYNWGPWYDCGFGVAPVREWEFHTVGGKRFRIEDTEANASILIPLLKMRFPGFVGDREMLMKLAHKIALEDGEARCWQATG